MNQPFRGILRPRFGGISADVATWLGSLDSDQKARIRQAAQDNLKRASAMVSRKIGARPVRRGPTREFTAPRALPDNQISEILEMVSALHAHQGRLGVSDADFVRRVPGLGSTTSWRHLAKWQPGMLNLSKWHKRLTAVTGSLDKSTPGWRSENNAAFPPKEFTALVDRLLRHADLEGWSQRKLAAKAGLVWRTWGR